MRKLTTITALGLIGLFVVSGCSVENNEGGQYPWQLHGTTPHPGYTTLNEEFEITDISDLITAEYQREIEDYIPFWTQSSDGSVVIHIRGPQGEPNFSAYWLLPPTGEGDMPQFSDMITTRILVVEEGWNGPVAELSRQWAFSIRGEDGGNIYPTEIQFIRYDANRENTILPVVIDGEWKDRLN